MKKIPYNVEMLISTLSPAQPVGIYVERGGHETLFMGKAIAARQSMPELMEREVKHVGINEINNESPVFIIEIFLYEG